MRVSQAVIVLVMVRIWNSLLSACLMYFSAGIRVYGILALEIFRVAKLSLAKLSLGANFPAVYSVQLFVALKKFRNKMEFLSQKRGWVIPPPHDPLRPILAISSPYSENWACRRVFGPKFGTLLF